LNRTILLGGTWKKNIVTRPTVFELATLVSEDPFSLGYTGLAFLNATVNLLEISDGNWPYIQPLGRYFGPTKAAVCQRTYPISRLIYLYANKPAGKSLSPIIREFLNYVLSFEGQKCAEDTKVWTPLPLEIVLTLRSEIGLA